MSTVNGYVESFIQRDITQTSGGYDVKAEITISASRIENFIGIAVGSASTVEGPALLAEQNRRIAQAQAERLQAKARVEIFDRLLRGFPSDVMDIRVLSTRLSQQNSNLIDVEFEYSFKPKFVGMFESTLTALGGVECPSQRIYVPPPLEMATGWCQWQTKDDAGRLIAKSVVCIGEGYWVVRNGDPTGIRCFALPPGNYCESCRLDIFNPRNDRNARAIVLLGRFIDAAGQSANIRDNCLASVVTANPNSRGPDPRRSGYYTYEPLPIEMFVARVTPRYGEGILAALDFGSRRAFVEINSADVDLSRAQHFVAVPALVEINSDQWNDPNRRVWINDLVPDRGLSPQKGCTQLLDEAVQRQMLTGFKN